MFSLLLTLAACDPSASKPDDGAEDTEVPDGDTGEPCVAHTWYADADGDGWGGASLTVCELPAGYVAAAGDCDDADPAVNPDAVELCDGLDQDCDGTADEGLATTAAAPDADGDGYGDAAGVVQVCALPEGWTADASDCDDANVDVFPGQIEWCNGYDDDCDGLVDDDDSPVTGTSTWYADADGDGYGDAAEDASVCAPPAGYVATDDDCDDADADVHPDAAEVCLDFVDQDCDGYTDDYSEDCGGGPIDGEIDLCDPAIVPVDVSLCTAGVAAVLPTGATYATVQDAIDAAAPGDVVSVCPGTWTEDLIQSVSPLSLAGYGAGTSVLEGAGGTVLSIGNGSTITVVDLTIQSGWASDGGGISGGNATVCIARSSFAGNQATYAGGALYLSGTGSLDIEDSTFYVNAADYEGGAFAIASYVTAIEDSTFYGNTAGSDAGAGTIDSTSVAAISRTEFTSNTAGYAAGALNYGGWGPATTLDLTDVTFTSNYADYEGGAMDLGSWDAPTVTCVSCVFDGNSSGYEGGAVNMGSWDAGTFNVTLSTFTANGSRSGGALNMGGWGSPTANFIACTFDANTATDGGGALELNIAGSAGVATVRIVDSTVTSNVAANGGGADVDRGYARLESTNTDWGTGATENTPDDVGGYTAYGAAATFTCTGGACF